MTQRYRFVVAVILLSVTGCLCARAGARAETHPRRVRVVYLVSSNRTENVEYTAAIEHAIRDLRKWYSQQLGGPTFYLSDMPVEVAMSGQSAEWFSSTPNGSDPDSWCFNNILAEAQRLCGARQTDPDFVWVICSDGPGNKGRGGGVVVCLPEDDLLGLVGRHPAQKDARRWIAGLGHELGHAFGLAHPSDTQRDANAIMWPGINGKFLDRACLTDGDRRVLMRSPFFFYKNGTPVMQSEKRGI